ncbi:Arc family DNA-binding protein [Streptomyces sp. NBC_00015]
MPCSHYSGVMDEEKRITLRLPAGLHERLAERARADRRSLNSEILHLLEAAISRADSDTASP